MSATPHPTIALLQTSSLTSVVQGELERMILSGELAPGEKLTEMALAARLGVSRGPLREAVSALSILGIVSTRQGNGTYVTNLDATQLLAPMGFVVDLHGQGDPGHVYTVRRLLESDAARLAATGITDEALCQARALLAESARIVGQAPHDHERLIEIDIAFHRIIAANTGNPVMIGLIEAFARRTVRGRLWRSLHEEGADRRTHDEHVAILRALASRDAEGARIRMANHLIGVEESLSALPNDGAAPME